MPKLAYALLVTLGLAACAQGSEIGLGGLGGGLTSGGPGNGPGPGNGSGSSGSQGNGSQTGAQTTDASGVTTTQDASTSEATDASSATTGEPCDEMPCKLVEPQCGCEDSRQCDVDATGVRSCVPAGTAAIGAACGDGNGCVPGATCLVTPTVGHCYEFCTNDAQCPGGGGRCILTLSDGMGGSVPGVNMCSESCDPVNATGCPTANTGCQPLQDQNMVGFTMCLDAGTVGDLGACPTGYECAPGFGCFNYGGNPTCLHWCDVAIGACPGGTSCFSLDPPAIVNGVNYGVCD